MWNINRIIIFLTIFEIVTLHVKCKEKITTKTFEPVTTTVVPVTHTHTYNIIQWENVNDTSEENKTDSSTVTETITTTTTENSNVNNVTVRTWVPADSANTFNTTSKNKTTKNYVKTEDCTFFKVTDTPFDLNRMADIWQTVYYQLPDKVQCFKMHIKKVSDEDRNFLKSTYGTFDDKVHWDSVFLEIRALTNIGRKHYLEGVNEDRGVLRNIILVEENSNYILNEEVADQWLVFQKLLLMRDCETGGVIVFSKVPHLPLHQDVEEALKEFSEEYGSGKAACEDDEPVNRYYETEEEGFDSFK